MHWPRCLVLTSEVTVMEVCMCHAKLEQFATVTKSLVTVPIYSWMLTKKKITAMMNVCIVFSQQVKK